MQKLLMLSLGKHMTDPTISGIHAVWEWVKELFYAILILFGWTVRQQVKRVDDIENREKAYIDDSTFNNTINALRGDIKQVGETYRDDLRDFREDMKSIHSRIDELMKK